MSDSDLEPRPAESADSAVSAVSADSGPASERPGRHVAWLLPVVAGLALLLAIVGCIGAAYALGRGDDPTVAGPVAGTMPRTITTDGTGTETGVPDEMLFDVAVTHTEADVATALAASNTGMRAVLHALRAYDVARRDVRTTGMNISPNYDYSGAIERLTGYTVTESAQVTVHTLAKGGGALGAAASADGNAVQIDSVSFAISKHDALLVAARKAAVRDAMASARDYATASGQHVEGILTLKETTSPAPTPIPANDAFGSAASKAMVPIRAGQQNLTVHVQVVWSIG